MKTLLIIVMLGAIAAGVCFVARGHADTPKTESIVVAGGCFWGGQSVFEPTKGVTVADTGHAESVQITYDPALYRE